MLKEASHDRGGRNYHFPAGWEAENIVFEKKLLHRISCFRANQSKSGNSFNFICGRLGLANLIVSENDFCDRWTLIPCFQTGVVYC